VQLQVQVQQVQLLEQLVERLVERLQGVQMLECREWQQ
jgi:hypothetical protein